MQCHNHVNRHFRLIAVDISKFKMQMVIAVLLRRLIAVFYHIRFQIQSDDFRLFLSDFYYIIIEDKCQLRFATSKVQNVDLILCFIFQHIINKLHEAIDLFVLVIHGTDNLSLFREYPHIHKWRNCHALL